MKGAVRAVHGVDDTGHRVVPAARLDGLDATFLIFGSVCSSHRVPSMSRSRRWMRSQGCQRWASVVTHARWGCEATQLRVRRIGRPSPPARSSRRNADRAPAPRETRRAYSPGRSGRRAGCGRRWRGRSPSSERRTRKDRAVGFLEGPQSIQLYPLWPSSCPVLGSSLSFSPSPSDQSPSLNGGAYLSTTLALQKRLWGDPEALRHLRRRKQASTALRREAGQESGEGNDRVEIRLPGAASAWIKSPFENPQAVDEEHDGPFEHPRRAQERSRPPIASWGPIGTHRAP